MTSVLRRIVVPLVVLAALAAVPVGAPRDTSPAAATVTAHTASSVIYLAGDSRVATASLNPSHRLQHRVEERFCGVHCPGQVVTVAGGGGCLIVRCGPAGLPSLVDRWVPEVLQATPKPTTVIVEIGVNDMFMKLPDGQIADGYKYLVNTGAQYGVKVLIGTVIGATLQYSARPVIEQQRENINRWLRDYYWPIIVDFDAALKAPWGEVLDAPYDSGDGLHLNPWGVVMMADTIRDAQIV